MKQGEVPLGSQVLSFPWMKGDESSLQIEDDGVTGENRDSYAMVKNVNRNLTLAVLR